METISIPSILEELKENWCCNAKNLRKIIVSPDKDRFIFKDDKYLLGKTDNKSDNFDKLLFARRDIEYALIPSNIKIISASAFYACKKLKKVEFAPNPNLNTIGECAFSMSNIKEIFIPSCVSNISKYSFCDCYNLKSFELAQDSKLQEINNGMFSDSNINQIFIPSSVSLIGDFSFSNNIQIIEISDGSNLQYLPPIGFSSHSKVIIMAPKSIQCLHFCYSIDQFSCDI